MGGLESVGLEVVGGLVFELIGGFLSLRLPSCNSRKVSHSKDILSAHYT